MFSNKLTLFKIFGFRVQIDPSWIIIAVLVTWSLAVGYFPKAVEDLSQITYWIMGVGGALGLFLSIIFHEFWHSLVARRYGLPMRGIILFVFGGISEMEDEPDNPKTEFLMAIAGPISSVILGFGFYALYLGSTALGLGQISAAILGYLAFINWILAGFNLLPVFPLDGGRVVRSAMWKWKDDLRWATEKASRFGAGFGIALIAVGALNLFTGQVVGGLWYCVIGLFLRSAAHMSYRQVLMRETFSDEKVRDLLKRTSPITVSSTTTIRDLVENYIYEYHFKMLPVVDRGHLQGCVSTHDLKKIDKKQWSEHQVREIMGECSEENTIAPNVPVMKAVKKIQRTGNSRLMVVEEDRLIGIITLKDIIQALSVRSDLDDN